MKTAQDLYMDRNVSGNKFVIIIVIIIIIISNCRFFNLLTLLAAPPDKKLAPSALTASTTPSSIGEFAYPSYTTSGHHLCNNLTLQFVVPFAVRRSHVSYLHINVAKKCHNLNPSKNHLFFYLNELEIGRS